MWLALFLSVDCFDVSPCCQHCFSSLDLPQAVQMASVVLLLHMYMSFDSAALSHFHAASPTMLFF
jgi:hypothetical protein